MLYGSPNQFSFWFYALTATTIRPIPYASAEPIDRRRVTNPPPRTAEMQGGLSWSNTESQLAVMWMCIFGLATHLF